VLLFFLTWGWGAAAGAAATGLATACGKKKGRERGDRIVSTRHGRAMCVSLCSAGPQQLFMTVWP
jgi:hypothetical protein